MSTETLATNQTIEQRLLDRLRQGMADLMTDDDIRKIIDRGMEAALFAERLNPGGARYGQPSYFPPLVMDLVTDGVKAQCKRLCEEWLDRHPELVQEQIQKLLTQKAGDMFLQTLEARFRPALEQLSQGLMNLSAKIPGV